MYMSIKIKGNKAIITNEFNIKKAIEIMEEQNYSDLYYVFKNEISQDIKQNLRSLLQDTLNKRHLSNKERIKKQIDKSIESLIEELVIAKVEEIINNYIKSNWGESKLKTMVSARIYQNFSEFVHPLVSKLMNKMITINPIELEEEMEWKLEGMQDEASYAHMLGREGR